MLLLAPVGRTVRYAWAAATGGASRRLRVVDPGAAWVGLMSLRLAHAVSRVKKDAEYGSTTVSDTLSRTFGGTSTSVSALLQDQANGTIRGAAIFFSRR